MSGVIRNVPPVTGDFSVEVRCAGTAKAWIRNRVMGGVESEGQCGKLNLLQNRPVAEECEMLLDT